MFIIFSQKTAESSSSQKKKKKKKLESFSNSVDDIRHKNEFCTYGFIEQGTREIDPKYESKQLKFHQNTSHERRTSCRSSLPDPLLPPTFRWKGLWGWEGLNFASMRFCRMSFRTFLDGTVKTEDAHGGDVTPGWCLLRSPLVFQTAETPFMVMCTTQVKGTTLDGHKREGNQTPTVLCKKAQRTTWEGKN